MRFLTIGFFHRGNSLFIKYLGEYEAICEAALARQSGA
jgi:hypothetical protein